MKAVGGFKGVWRFASAISAGTGRMRECRDRDERGRNKLSLCCTQLMGKD